MKTFTQNTAIISALVILAVALGNAGSTLYMPAFVDMTHKLNTDSAMMKLTLSCYLLCFGLSQLLYGPLSDAFGRRPNLVIGVFIFLIGSVISLFSISVGMLMVGRCIEGLGIGAANAVGYALMRDIYSGGKLIRQMGYISLFVGATPIIAPLLGGYLVEYIDWQACFIALAIVAAALVLLKFFLLPETIKFKNPQAHKPGTILKNYGFLLSQPVFLGNILAAAMGFSSLIALNAMMPFLLINKLGFTPSIYGWLTICTGAGYMLGSLLGGNIAAKFGTYRIMMLGLCIDIVVLVVSYFISLELMNAWVIIIPLALTLFGIGFIIPVGSGAAMSPFPEKAGSSAALLGACLFCFSGIVTAVASHVHENTQQPLMIFLLVTTIITLAVLQITRIKSKEK